MKPGDHVVLRDTGEKGIVVHSWYDTDLDITDCYVAFFGEQWPDPNEKPDKPYVLRYWSGALELVEA